MKKEEKYMLIIILGGLALALSLLVIIYLLKTNSIQADQLKDLCDMNNNVIDLSNSLISQVNHDNPGANLKNLTAIDCEVLLK